MARINQNCISGNINIYMITMYNFFKGMVLIHPKLEPKACKEFEATIYLLFHANQIHKGFQATVHIGNVCQTASITFMDRVK